jgi:hypothetical protein
MSRISTRDLKPGMKLIRAVENKNGLVMIGQDTELTPPLIDKIRDMDIPSVYIHGEVRTLPPKEDQLAGLHSRFKKVDSDPYLAMVKTAILEHIESLYEEHGPTDPER